MARHGWPWCRTAQQVGDRYLPCFRELRLVLRERVQANVAEAPDG
jgi:hypothetical protein